MTSADMSSSIVSSNPDPSAEDKSISVSSLLALLVVVVAVIATFWPVLRCEFVYRDDDATLFENPYLNPPTLHGVVRYWTWPAMKLYVPVTYTAWSALAALSPSPEAPGQPFVLEPMPFHAANLFVHIVSAIFAWLILKRFFGSAWAACAGSLLFALHPVQVETVAWASGLKDLLAGCFSLIAVWQYFRLLDASSPAQRRWRLFLTLVWLTLGQLSKPSAVVVPLIIIALDWLLNGRPLKRVARDVVPIFLFCVPVMIVARIVQNVPSEATLLERPLIVLHTLSFYAAKIVWPAALAPDYALPPSAVLAGRWIRWCWVIPAIAVIVPVLGWRRRPAWLAGATIFIAGILPVVGLLTFQFEAQSTVSDHYLYVSMLGVGLIATAALARARSIVLWLIAFGLIGALAVRSYRQARYWHDTISLFTRNAEVIPWSYRAQTQIGYVLLKQGHPREAEPHFRAALAINPLPMNVGNLAASLLDQGRTQEAIDAALPLVQHDPTNEDARLLLATAYLKEGRRDDAIEQLNFILKQNPQQPRARQMLLSLQAY
jgi:tetratricopeptide (TPR) repeat protein